MKASEMANLAVSALRSKAENWWQQNGNALFAAMHKRAIEGDFSFSISSADNSPFRGLLSLTDKEVVFDKLRNLGYTVKYYPSDGRYDSEAVISWDNARRGVNPLDM